MDEEFIKGLSTEQLLRHAIILIDEHVALSKTKNTDGKAYSKKLLLMISKEISARNTPKRS